MQRSAAVIQAFLNHFYAYANYCITALARIILLQLILTCISAIITICWGLPISILSIPGNILMGPLLTIFLLLVTAQFFIVLISGYPLHILSHIINYFTDWWIWLLSHHPRACFIAIKQPPIFAICIIVCISLGILTHPYTRKTLLRTYSALAIIISVLIILHTWWKQQPRTVTIPIQHKKIIITAYNNKISILDSGAISTIKSIQSWTDYTLIPTIIKNTGSLTISALHIPTLTYRALAMIKRLTRIMTIEKTILNQHPKPAHANLHKELLLYVSQIEYKDSKHATNKKGTVHGSKTKSIIGRCK